MTYFNKRLRRDEAGSSVVVENQLLSPAIFVSQQRCFWTVTAVPLSPSPLHRFPAPYEEWLEHQSDPSQDAGCLSVSSEQVLRRDER